MKLLNGSSPPPAEMALPSDANIQHAPRRGASSSSSPLAKLNQYPVLKKPSGSPPALRMSESVAYQYVENRYCEAVSLFEIRSWTTSRSASGECRFSSGPSTLATVGS
jgi:hypothetical protein